MRTLQDCLPRCAGVCHISRRPGISICDQCTAQLSPGVHVRAEYVTECTCNEAFSPVRYGFGPCRLRTLQEAMQASQRRLAPAGAACGAGPGAGCSPALCGAGNSAIAPTQSSTRCKLPKKITTLQPSAARGSLGASGLIGESDFAAQLNKSMNAREQPLHEQRSVQTSG